MSFRNRCQIAGGEGMIDLSIPLEKGRDQKTLMKDVRIAGSRAWQAQHWKTIVSCYSRSPWFEFYRDELEGLYKTRYNFLIDWDLACFEWTVKALRLPLTVSLTETWKAVYPPEEAVDYRGKFLPKNGGLLSGQDAGTGGRTPSSGDPIPVPGESQIPGQAPPVTPLRYRQVFEERTGFIPGLSILDCLFCEGKEAIRYIRS